MIFGKPALYKCSSPHLRANHQCIRSSAAADSTMRVNALFFLTIITACVCLTLAQVTYEDCCLRYVKRMRVRTQRNAIDYRLQVPDGGCNLPAVIITTKTGRIVCTNPKEKWVDDLMRSIDARKLMKHSRKYSYKG